MNNPDTEAAWTYHNATKHSYQSVRTGGHYLDWSNQPLLFKIYSTLDPAPLPMEFQPSSMAALPVLTGSREAPIRDAVPDLSSLAQILYFSAGITKRRRHAAGEMLFRAAACTGALYEIELYVVSRELPGLEAGVYHFSPGDFGLRKLRAGNYTSILVQATSGEPAISHSSFTIISTGSYWRNAWKYQARTYRHFGWDNGTILANMLAMATALRIPARLVCGFVDDEINRLLDLDTRREVALSMVAIGNGFGFPPEPPDEVVPLGLSTVALSKSEVDYPAMRQMHEASSLRSPEEVLAWRSQPLKKNAPAPTGQAIPLASLHPNDDSSPLLEEVILRRGSTRNFARESITFSQLSHMLRALTPELPADFRDRQDQPATADSQLNDVYLIVHAVEGLHSGAYVFHRSRNELEFLVAGDFRKNACFLGLEQALPGDASVDVFFMSDLRSVLERFGNRGYRAVQLEAGILGGRLYLAAYAQGLGATGLTFYDDDVTAFFSPHAKDKSAIFLVALGRSAKKRIREA